jgi:hypothetical protein
MLTACGGSSQSGAENETSSDMVAPEINIVLTDEQMEAENEVSNTLESSAVTAYKKADWIPELDTAGTSQKISTVNNTLPLTVTSSKVESNGEDTTGWYTYDADPAGATITSVYDSSRGSKVICLSGEGIKNGYTLGWTAHDWDTSTNKLMKWSDTTHNTIKWSMKYSADEDYIIYVRLSTKDGYRYLYYTNHNQNFGEISYDSPHYIHHGLGTASNDGTWRTFTRNLSADLKEFQPTNEIISIDGFFVRGSGCIDDVELLSTNCEVINEVIYEDAEDAQTSRWSVYDQSPTGAKIENVLDNGSRAIALTGSGLDNGFILGAWNKNNGWKNTINKEISWDMKYNEYYVIYISVETAQGHRFITYTPLSVETCATYRSTGELPSPQFGTQTHGGYTYIHLGLCPDSKDGTWQTITRNLEADLKKYEPSNSLQLVNAFLVRGSGRLDNIKMFDSNADCDNDNSTN